jgi:hypothetical protein
MKFAITKEQRNFFQKHGWIEFEECLSFDQIALFNQMIDNILASRLQKPIEKLKQLSSGQLFMQGRDLWRSNPSLLALIRQLQFGQIASELIEKKPLRIGYDQFFSSQNEALLEKETTTHYAHFIKDSIALEEVSCLEGIACALMLALGPKNNHLTEKADSTEGMNIFPTTPGNVIFFLPNFPIDWSKLHTFSNQNFYLIVCTHGRAFYRLQPKDPHTYALKHLGYIFHDQLNDKINPIIYR